MKSGMTVRSTCERTPGPFLIDFQIDPEANVYPIVPLGKGLDHFQEEPYDI